MLMFVCSCGFRISLPETSLTVVPVPYFGKSSKGTIYYTRCRAFGCMNVIKIYRKDDFNNVCDLVETPSE